MHHARPLRFAFLILAAAASALLAPLARAAEATERWYVVMMQGQRVGWMHEKQVEDGETITSSSAMRLSIGRGAAAVSISIQSEFVETAGHRPVSMRSSQTLGAMPVEKTYTFDGDTVRLLERQGGRELTRELPAPEGEWLTPAAASARFEALLAQGERAFELSTLDPLMGLTRVVSSYEIEGEENIEAMGKVVPALRVKVRMSVQPGVVSTSHIDAQGAQVRSETGIGGITLTVLHSEREVALSPVEPLELVASTLVRPDRPIDNPRRTTKAVYHMTIGDEPMPFLPEAASQRVERLADGSVRVRIATTDPRPAPAEDSTNPGFLEASGMINHKDPAIVALTGKALEGAPADPAARAETLRRFVFDYIDAKSLGVGLATASEVCRTREGDCTEHAVLLAALLRADAIPSRVASGLIYADAFLGRESVFGYHMWTQALLVLDGEPTWIDLDATLPHDAPYDATHITLGVSSMGEGDTINSMATLAPLMGRLAITVEAVE